MTVNVCNELVQETPGEVIAAGENPPCRYLLVREKEFYSLVIRGEGESCLLSDIGRDEARARAVLALFAESGVPPCTAREVAEELLARDPAIFT